MTVARNTSATPSELNGGPRRERYRAPQAISFYVIAVDVDEAKTNDEYAVIRSDNDYQYARPLDAAAILADEMRS